MVNYNQMVVYQSAHQSTDHVFHALADDTRRDILRRCARGDPMCFAAVQKHVAVLERAGLVSKERRGREQLVRTAPNAVRRARQTLDELEATWRGRVDRMSHVLAEDADPEEKNPTRGRER